MSVFASGDEPGFPFRAVAARFAALFAAATVSGCASMTASNQNQTAPVQVAAAQVQTQVRDMEADGKPAQTPPSSRIRALPDDPDEPFSKNYGGRNPAADKHFLPPRPAAVAAKDAPDIPYDLPPAFRKKLMQAMNEDE